MYLGIDLGTSGVKILIIDATQNVVAEATSPVESLAVQPPYSEQNPHSWLRAIEKAFEEIKARNPGIFGQVRGIGLSGHMHGAVLIDRHDAVLRPCIMWDDGRSHLECEELSEAAAFERIGGNLVMAGFTAPKLRWVEKNEPEIFDKIGKVLLPKDYVRLWLTGEYAAEMSDAAGTLWLDVEKREWSQTLLEATNLSADQMPRLYEGTEVTGTVRGELCDTWGFSPGTVVAGGAGDNAAAACGMGIVEDGAFLSLGTSGVVFAPTKAFLPNVERGVHAFCHAVPGVWHQMGVILAAASCLEWLARTMQTDVASALNQLPQTINGPSSVCFLPYLTGVRTPHNDPRARASFNGVTNRTQNADLVQAVLEGVGFALKDCFIALAEGKTEITEAYAVGGGSRSQEWLQIIANICGVSLMIPERGEYGAAFGAARLGMSAALEGYDAGIFSKPPVKQVVAPQADLASAYSDAHGEFQDLYRR
ncbi:MAG: xylulokinase [Stappiaceae bacterium]